MNRNARRGLAFAAVAVLMTVPGLAQAEPTTPLTPGPSASADARTANYSVSVTTPTGDYSPVHLTITGLKHGESVRVKGAPEGWRAENWYDRGVVQQGDGPLRVEIEAPLGWPEDHAFVWEVTFPGGVTRTTSFVYPGSTGPTAKPTAKPTNTKKPTTKPTSTKKPTVKKDQSGGLAKTGV